MGWGIRLTLLSEQLEKATEFDDECMQSFTLLERAVCSTFLTDMLLKLLPKCNINKSRVVVLRCVWTNLRTELFTAYTSLWVHAADAFQPVGCMFIQRYWRAWYQRLTQEGEREGYHESDIEDMKFRQFLMARTWDNDRANNKVQNVY